MTDLKKLLKSPLTFNITAKNVAADISYKLCNSVAAKLEGKVLGTFTGMCVKIIYITKLLILRYFTIYNLFYFMKLCFILTVLLAV